MDRRRNDYDSSSYKPSYAGNHYDRDSRANIPSRSNSHVSRTFRAPDNRPSNSPSDSPQSPQTSYGENTRTALTNKATVSKDPRRTRGPESSVSEKLHQTSYDSTVADYFRELARQVSYEDRVQEAERKLKATQQDERTLKEKFPDKNPLTDQITKHRQRDEDALSKCKNLLAESKDQAEKTLASLHPKTKDLFSGVIPTPKESSPRDELNDVKSAMKSLEEKIESLTKQNKQQEMELKQMRERNAELPSEPLEAKLNSKITAFQRDVDSKFMALDGKLQKYDESMTLHEKIINQQKEDLQRQSSEIRSLTSKQIGVTDPLAAFQSRVDKLEASIAEQVPRETPRSPPRDDFEDEVAEIKDQQKEQRRQIANLSNMFVSRQEYTEGISQLEVSAGSMKKLLQDTDQAHQDLSSKIPTIVDRANQLADDLDKIKTSMQDISTVDSKILHERVDALQKSTEDLQKSIDTLSIVPAQTVAQAPAHDAEVLLQLQEEVKKLSNFSGHYEKFYGDTQEQLKLVNQRLTADDARMTEMKNDYQSCFDILSEICKKNKNDLDRSNDRQKSEAEEQRRHMNDMRKQINGCETSAVSAFAQNAGIATDIKALKASVEQASHSIQSLDTRYSAISTQKLYHSIVATIQPLIPRILELTDQILSVRNAILVCEQRTTLINDKIKSMEVSKVETETKIQALEDKARDTPAIHAGQLVNPQLGGEILQEAPSSSVQANSKLQNEVVSLKNQHSSYMSQLQALQDKFATIDQALKDHQKTYPKVVDDFDEIRDALREIRSDTATLKTSLGEESKIVEKLRADAVIMNDLQSLVQSVQTEVTTHQERLAKIEIDSLHAQDMEQRLKQLQTKFEEKQVEGASLDVLHAGIEKSKEEINDSGMKDVELRVRVHKLEQIVIPATDRYIVCDNLASKINDEKVRLCFRDCAIRTVQFGGGKIPITHKTTRYAIVWIALSTEDSVIDEAIEQQNGKKWDGRRPTIRRITRDQFRMIWMEEPDSIRNYIPDLPSLSSDRVSEAATTPGPIRGRSVSNTEQLVPDNTIEVVRSSVLPKKSSTSLDITELPESDEEDLLEQFGATRDGRTSKPKIPIRAGSTRPSTPSTRGAAKRSAPDSGSSRPSSKRGRRG